MLLVDNKTGKAETYFVLLIELLMRLGSKNELWANLLFMVLQRLDLTGQNTHAFKTFFG